MTWENDERGKPCKWVRVITAPDADRIQGALPADKVKEIDDAFKECWSATQQLVDTGEYVVIVPAQIVEDRDFEAEAWKYIVRARVRWVTPEAKANRERNLAAMFDAADDEYEKVMTERAGGRPN